MVTGAKLLVEALKKEKVEVLFGYPGGYVIPVFDELYTEQSIKVVLPRHEQGLVHAADGYARSTGKVGVCIVTSGPGATNIITGIATAFHDSVPLVCFTGQVPVHLIGKDSFQEADIVGMTESITKNNYLVKDRKELGRIIKEAFFIAQSGRPGPVVIDMPVNILNEEGEEGYPEDINIPGYNAKWDLDINLIKKAADELMKAEKPLFLIGGGLQSSNASMNLIKLIEKTNIPVISTLMGKGAVPSSHRLYLGMVGMHGSYTANKAVSECDLLFSIGTRFSDRITGKTSDFAKNARIIHVDIDPSVISKNVAASLYIIGDSTKITEKIIPMVGKADISCWTDKINKWCKEYSFKTKPNERGISPVEIINSVNEIFSDAIITTGVGQHQMWTAQFYDFKKPGTFITSGGLGTMGYGFPAAIGAAIGNKGKRVVCITGDGSMQMNIQELATAVIQELPIIIIVLNNSFLGMVRQWQELFYNKKYSATCLKKRVSCPMECNTCGENCPKYTPDFVKLAKAYEAKGIRITKSKEIIPALKEAEKSLNKPVLIECIIENECNVMPMVPSGAPLSDMIT